MFICYRNKHGLRTEWRGGDGASRWAGRAVSSSALRGVILRLQYYVFEYVENREKHTTCRGSWFSSNNKKPETYLLSRGSSPDNVPAKQTHSNAWPWRSFGCDVLRAGLRKPELCLLLKRKFKLCWRKSRNFVRKETFVLSAAPNEYSRGPVCSAVSPCRSKWTYPAFIVFRLLSNQNSLERRYHC